MYSIAACVYLATRLEKVPIMIADIAESFGIDYTRLGRTFLLIKKGLFISLPGLNMEGLVRRFVTELNVKVVDKAACNMAIVVMDYMNDFWMGMGYTPGSICGAAVLVAIRCLCIKVTPKAVAEVAKVNVRTIFSRLRDIGETDIAKMNVFGA